MYNNIDLINIWLINRMHKGNDNIDIVGPATAVLVPMIMIDKKLLGVTKRAACLVRRITTLEREHE